MIWPLLPLAAFANEWEDKSTIDRAHLFVSGEKWNQAPNGLILNLFITLRYDWFSPIVV